MSPRVSITRSRAGHYTATPSAPYWGQCSGAVRLTRISRSQGKLSSIERAQAAAVDLRAEVLAEAERNQ